MKNKETELYGRIPPQAIEVEQAVLGALMLEENVFGAISGYIDASSFYRDEHGKIFEVIKALTEKNNSVDLITVTQELKNMNILEEIGGPKYLTSLTRNVISAANIGAHARIIAEMAFKRKTIHNATELIKMAYENEDVDILSTQWKSAMESLENIFTVADAGSRIDQVLRNTIAEIERDCIAASENKTPGITTGFDSLNFITGGWRNGNMVVLASRPGIGKTSFALQFALSAAKSGSWVNMFGFEMNKEDLTRILISSESRINRSDIRDGMLTQSGWQSINRAVAKLEKLPIIFKDAAGMSINQVNNLIHRNRKNGKCDFVIIDYLQLVKSTQAKNIREQEVSEISRSLKAVALTEKIPILALSQLNREADGKIPNLSHLRESGAIEQDADLVIFLSPDGEGILFTIAKHRRGKMGEFRIYHDGQMTRFSEQPFDENEIPHPDQRIEAIKPFKIKWE